MATRNQGRLRGCRVRALMAASFAALAALGAVAVDAGPLQGLESPEGGWPVQVPGRSGHELELAQHEGIDAGIPERARLVFEARLTRPWASAVRLSLHVQNRQGWYYQTARLKVVPYKPEGRWATIDIDFTPTSSDWEGVGHGRPWDELSARGIFRAGIRLYSESSYEGELLVRGMRWERAGWRAPSLPAEVVDLREPPGPVRAGELWELAFRVAGPIFNPFDPEEADFVCEVVMPEGGVDRVPAFLYQEYARAERGEPVAVGPPEWRVRYRPRAQGRMRYGLFLGWGGETPRSPAAEGWFTVSGEAARPAPAVEPAPPPTEFVLELGGGTRDGQWRPLLASRPATWRDGEFRREYMPVPGRAWNVMLEWTRRWHHWEGLGVYDLGIAARFDAALAGAEARGESLPFALVTDGPFLEHGKYRWPMNPLCRSEGGPLPGPGEFFTSDEAARYFLMRARYAIARWGHSPAIESWCVASGLPAAEVREWHVAVAKELEKLDHRVARGRDVVSLHPFAVPFRASPPLGEFEAGAPSGWKLDKDESEGAKLAHAKSRGQGGGDALEVAFPEIDRRAVAETSGASQAPPKEGLPGFRWVKINRELDADLFDFDYLTFDVRMPDGAEGVGRAQVIMRDRDLLWYECLLETPLRAGDWTRVVLDLSTAAGQLRPVGHARPWAGWARSRIRELGIRVFPNGPVPAPALVDHVLIHSIERETAPLEIKVSSAGPERVGRFERYEIVMDLGREFPNPFDPEVVALDAVFTHEGGEALVVPGFFYEPYERRLAPAKVVEFGRELERPYEFVDVSGPSDWRVRFAPTRTGRWRSTLRVKTPRETVEKPGPTFTCVGSDRRGFLRVARDNRYFEHSTGEVFYPLGPVLRSPSDSRDLNRDPGIRDKILAANYRGTYQFDEYLDGLSKGGGNWVRMWLCSWWCALEWYRKWPGYGGAGWYNMRNAWRLDHVLELAEKKGVYLQLCLQNHGQTSEHIDHEWEYHPYNLYEPEVFVNRETKDQQVQMSPALKSDPAYKRPGGWLENAAEFYSNQRARDMKKKLYRYIIARWGYSTSVFAWVLSSEIEFTGEYWRLQYGHDDRELQSPPGPPGTWRFDGVDRAVNTAEYHREMARYIKGADPFKHIVTSHLSHPHRGRGVWKVPELEYVQSNAYTTFARWKWFKGPVDGRGAVSVPFAMEQYVSEYVGKYGRPMILGEWGGHWMGNPVYSLEAELHSGTWSSIMTPMAGATGFWWWLHVHYHDRYGVYGAAGRFLAGEDRRGLGLRQMQAKFEGNCAGLYATVLGNETRADAYVFHVQHTFNPGTAPVLEGAQFVLPGLKEGMYAVEFWDTVEGKATGRKAAPSVGGSLKVLLPAVKGDLALKVRALE